MKSKINLFLFFLIFFCFLKTSEAAIVTHNWNGHVDNNYLDSRFSVNDNVLITYSYDTEADAYQDGEFLWAGGTSLSIEINGFIFESTVPFGAGNHLEIYNTGFFSTSNINDPLSLSDTWGYPIISRSAYISFSGAPSSVPMGITDIEGIIENAQNSRFYIEYEFVVDDSPEFFDTAYLDIDGAIDGPATVPIPAAAWLLGSGLIGLIGIRRRFRN